MKSAASPPSPTSPGFSSHRSSEERSTELLKRLKLAFIALLLRSLLAVLIIPISSNVWVFYLTVSGISALDILHRYYGFSLIASMTLDGSELQGLNARLAMVGNSVSLVAFPLAGTHSYRFGIKAVLLGVLLHLIGCSRWLRI